MVCVCTSALMDAVGNLPLKPGNFVKCFQLIAFDDVVVNKRGIPLLGNDFVSPVKFFRELSMFKVGCRNEMIVARDFGSVLKLKA